MIYFTADTHFGHQNIIKYCNRPFRDYREMDEILIANWNNVVKPSDIIYHLGDFFYTANKRRIKEILDRLVGRIILIKGSHDNSIAKKFSYRFESIHDVLEITIDKEHIFLSHYCHRVWPKSHYGSWHLFGHSHGTLNKYIEGNLLDVGVDNHNYQPVSFERIREIMKTKSKDVLTKGNQ